MFGTLSVPRTQGPESVRLENPASSERKDRATNNSSEPRQGQFRLILPAGTAIGMRLRHASREVQDLGGRLSNTRITCPGVGDNLGKLRIIPHRCGMLECFHAESSGAPGWVCGLSGCSGCNGPTNLRRVRALREVARRWILRHESRSYGAQQARKLRNVGNHDEGIPSANDFSLAVALSKKQGE